MSTDNTDQIAELKKFCRVLAAVSALCFLAIGYLLATSGRQAQVKVGKEELDSHLESQRLEAQSLKEALAKANGSLSKVSDELAQLKMATPPVGAILAYYGSTTNLNSSWVLCDGRATGSSGWERVPDVRQKFLRGVDDRDGTYALGSTGGTDAIPNHWHVVTGSSTDISFGVDSLNGWTASYSPVKAANGLQVDGSQVTLSRIGTRSHGHSGGTASFKGKSDEDGGHDNRPAFVSVNFVCRVQ